MLLCAAVGALALAAAMRRNSWSGRALAAALLTLAIAGHHVLAMNAIAFMPDPAIAIPEFAVPSGWLAVGVAIASLTIVLFAGGGLALDARERRRAKREGDRMRGLADAAVEGLLVCRGESIVTFNSSLTELTGYRAEDLTDAPLALFLPDEAARRLLLENPRRPVESLLRRADGEMAPAEFILRAIDYGGEPHNAIAVRDLRDRKKAEDDIRFLAHHDGLTGLPNRNFFNARLDEEIEAHRASARSLAVFCLDLDRFKEVNDLFGHAAGDAVLKRVAECVTGVLDHTQTMARLGGDEFAIIVTDIAGPVAAGRVAEAIIDALHRDYETSPSGHFVSTSIGIAIYPADAGDRRGLLTHADTALYRAKADGRAAYRFFEPEMGAEVRDRRVLEHDLRNALVRRELRLVYQPQARASTSE